MIHVRSAQRRSPTPTGLHAADQVDNKVDGAGRVGMRQGLRKREGKGRADLEAGKKSSVSCAG